MTPLYLTAGIRAMETAHGTTGLMEKAGLAVATLARALLPEEDEAILIVAGPGNNGGDAFVAARHLQSWWLRVDVLFIGNPETLPPDASTAYQAWMAAGGIPLRAIPDKRYGLVIDGLFGIGLSKPLLGEYAELVERINGLDATVLAIDIPSGLDADSGRQLGTAVRADHTLTFLGLKPGLFTLDGVDCAGTVHVSDLGVAPEAVARGWLVDATPSLPQSRLRNSHKGSNGSVGVLGGEHAMVGAALLTARAALLIGAGRVYCGLLAHDAPAYDSAQPELMLRDPAQLPELQHLTALAVGPGLGRSQRAAELLSQALTHPAPLILDADGLNLLPQKAELQYMLTRRAPGQTLLTPHPREAATLLGCDTAEIQASRVDSALRLAQNHQAIVLLKGAGTVIATPDGRWFVNASGNPGLASAGMGDTLAGIIAGLAAQGMPLEEATLLGVYLHGAAADALVEAGSGPIGLTASEVALASRDLINQWTRSNRA